MKKLMVAFAAVTMSVAANAGCFAWGFGSGNDVDSDGQLLMGATAFLFDGTVGMKSNGDGTYSLDFGTLNMIASGSFVDPGNFDYTIGSPSFKAEVTDPRISDTTPQAYSLLLVDSDGVTDYANYEGNFFLYATDGAGDPVKSIIAQDPASETWYAQMVYAPAVGKDDWKKAAAVPEPTSGLLLLLGVAGLALKRRRA